MQCARPASACGRAQQMRPLLRAQRTCGGLPLCDPVVHLVTLPSLTARGRLPCAADPGRLSGAPAPKFACWIRHSSPVAPVPPYTVLISLFSVSCCLRLVPCRPLGNPQGKLALTAASEPHSWGAHQGTLYTWAASLHPKKRQYHTLPQALAPRRVCCVRLIARPARFAQRRPGMLRCLNEAVPYQARRPAPCLHCASAAR